MSVDDKEGSWLETAGTFVVSVDALDTSRVCCSRWSNELKETTNRFLDWVT